MFYIVPCELCIMQGPGPGDFSIPPPSLTLEEHQIHGVCIVCAVYSTLYCVQCVMCDLYTVNCALQIFTELDGHEGNLDLVREDATNVFSWDEGPDIYLEQEAQVRVAFNKVQLVKLLL